MQDRTRVTQIAWLALGLASLGPSRRGRAEPASEERLAKKCEAGHGRSCFALAVRAVRRGDAAAAVPLYRTACERGHSRSCYNLATLLKKQSAGGARDDAEAGRLYARACAAGFAQACRKPTPPADAAPSASAAPERPKAPAEAAEPAEAPAADGLASLRQRCNQLDERACERLGERFTARSEARKRRAYSESR
jgi:hypothetical protein